MIATALIFVFGFFAALLIALLLSPLLWRRSRRVARREFEATIPASANEIGASYDHVRAEAALSSRRREMGAHALEEKAALDRAEAGRVFLENARLRESHNELEERLARQQGEISEAATVFERHEKDFEQLVLQIEETERDLDLRRDEIEALAVKYRDLEQVAEERRQIIAALEAQVRELGGKPARTEANEAHALSAKGLVERFRGESPRRRSDAGDDAIATSAATSTAGAAADAAISGEPPAEAPVPAPATTEIPPAQTQRPGLKALLAPEDFTIDYDTLDEEGLRDRIAEIAARVVSTASLVEGPDSPLHEILSREPLEPDGDEPPTLAARIRRLLDETSNAKDTAETRLREEAAE